MLQNESCMMTKSTGRIFHGRRMTFFHSIAPATQFRENVPTMYEKYRTPA